MSGLRAWRSGWVEKEGRSASGDRSESCWRMEDLAFSPVPRKRQVRRQRDVEGKPAEQHKAEPGDVAASLEAKLMVKLRQSGKVRWRLHYVQGIHLERGKHRFDDGNLACVTSNRLKL